MSAILHEDGAVETIPGLLVTELPGQDSRVARLLIEAAELRAERDKLRDMLHEQQRLTSAQAAQIGVLRREIDTLVGRNAAPQPGCRFATVSVGDAEVLVEYEYTAEEVGSTDIESPAFGPSYPEEVKPLQVLVNGKWCDPEDVAMAMDLDRLAEKCTEALQDERDAAEAAHIDSMEP